MRLVMLFITCLQLFLESVYQERRFPKDPGREKLQPRVAAPEAFLSMS